MRRLEEKCRSLELSPGGPILASPMEPARSPLLGVSSRRRTRSFNEDYSLASAAGDARAAVSSHDEADSRTPVLHRSGLGLAFSQHHSHVPTDPVSSGASTPLMSSLDSPGISRARLSSASTPVQVRFPV